MAAAKTSPRDRARKLVALAAGTKGPEASSAALKACALIAEHKLLDEEPSTIAAAGGLVDKIKQAAADPEIQKAAGAAADLLGAIAAFRKR